VQAAAAFDRLVEEKVRQPRLCTGCGKPRPDRASPRCPDCVLEERRLSRIAKSPPPAPRDDDDFEVVWSGSITHVDAAED
jgi:hypothetical protein